MCERYGIYNCRNLDDMMEAALAFDGGRLPKGPRIGFVTTSGGTVDLLYDYAEVEGASMPDYSPETLKGTRCPTCRKASSRRTRSTSAFPAGSSRRPASATSWRRIPTST